ncbi:MAG: VWA domain-containing protein [Pseudomonadota bacterium]
MEIILLLILLGLWALVGMAIWWWGTRCPAPGARGVVRRADRRVARVGDAVGVTLHLDHRELPANPNPNQQRFRVVLILDHSGSMGHGPGSPLQEAKRAAHNFVERVVGAHNQVGVVAFSDSAQEASPITDQPGALFRALDQIGPGGGTAIETGLAVAGQMLGRARAKSEEGREELVVLLSDGGSDPRTAKEQAAKLKEAGVIVTCLALGDSEGHHELLRALATSDEHFFATLEPKDLTRLYEHLALSLEEVRAFQVDLYDTYNRQKFNYTSHGRVNPHAWNPVQGGLTWYLPFLHGGDNQVSYQLTPTLPGWHHLAAGPARMVALDAKGLSHEKFSNRGPRLLVLPAWCPIFLHWLLNPLLWLLVGWFRKRASLPPVIPELPLKPFRKPPEARLVAIATQPNFKPQLQPALVVGLGDGGGQVLARLKKELAGLYPPDGPPPPVVLLWVHTGQERQASLPAPVFSEQERLDLCQGVDFEQRLRQVDQDPAAYPHLAWLDARRLLDRYPDLNRPDTLGQERPLARAAWFFNREAAWQRLDQRLQALLQGPAKGQPLDVLLVCAGEQAANGALGDLALGLRARLEKAGRSSAGLSLYLYSEAGAQPPADQCANYQALLREVEWLAGQADQPPIEAVYGPGPAERLTAVRVLDRVFWIDPPAGGPSGGTLAALTSQAMLLWLLSPNLRGHFQGQSQAEAGVARASGQTAVTSLGLSVLRLPVDDLMEVLSLRLLRELIGDRLLRVQEQQGRFTLPRDAQTDQDVQTALALLQSSSELVRERPLILPCLVNLTQDATYLDAVKALGGLFQFADALVTEDSLRLDLDRLSLLLEEWLSVCLNGTLELAGQTDAGVQVAARRGKLAAALAALESLAGQCDAAILHTQAAKDKGQFALAGVVFSADSLIEALTSFRSRLRQAHAALEMWDWALVDGPPPAKAFQLGGKEDDPQATLGLCRALNDAYQAARLRLAAWPASGALAYLCNDNVQDVLYKRHYDPWRDDLVSRFIWEPRLSRDRQGFQVRLRLLGRHDQRFDPQVDQVQGLCRELQTILGNHCAWLADQPVAAFAPNPIAGLWAGLKLVPPQVEASWQKDEVQRLHYYAWPPTDAALCEKDLSGRTNITLHDLQSREPGRLALLHSRACQALRNTTSYARVYANPTPLNDLHLVWPELIQSSLAARAAASMGLGHLNILPSLSGSLAQPAGLLGFSAALAAGKLDWRLGRHRNYLVVRHEQQAFSLTTEEAAERGDNLLLAGLQGWLGLQSQLGPLGSAWLEQLPPWPEPFSEQGPARQELERLNLWDASGLARQLLQLAHLLWLRGPGATEVVP